MYDCTLIYMNERRINLDSFRVLSALVYRSNLDNEPSYETNHLSDQTC